MIELMSLIKPGEPLYIPLVRGVPMEGANLLDKLVTARGASEKPGDILAALERLRFTVMIEKGTQRALYIGRRADVGPANRYREARRHGRSYPSVRRDALDELGRAHKALLESDRVRGVAGIIANALDMSEAEASNLSRILGVMRVVVFTGYGPASEYCVVEETILLTQERLNAARAAAGGNAVAPGLVAEFHCGELLGRLRAVANPYTGQLPISPRQLCTEWELPKAKIDHLPHLAERSLLWPNGSGWLVRLAESTEEAEVDVARS